MKKISILLVVFACFSSAFAQMPVYVTPAEIPESAKKLASEYIVALQNAATVEEAAAAVAPLCAGAIVGADHKFNSVVMSYTFPKDYEVAKAYSIPITFERASITKDVKMGSGDNAISGTEYTVYVFLDGPETMSYPISIVVPNEASTVQETRITSVGSLRN